MLRFGSILRSGVKILGNNRILPCSDRSTIKNIRYIIIRHSSYDAYKDNKYKHGFKKNNFFINRYGNNVSDPNLVEFNKKTLAKLIYLPNHAPSSSSSDGDIDDPITLQKLYDESIIDRSLFLSIQRMNFPNLTPVQQRTIKPILLNDNKHDIITRAKTGTGKTFSFLIPIFQHLINTNKQHPYMVKTVIIAPTRDLALQIETEVKKIHYHNRALSKYQCVSLVGGTNLPKSLDFMHKRRPNIVIATPGRFIDILNRVGEKFFKFVDFKVLDEADRLLEIGFKQDLEYISQTLNELNFNGQSHIRTLLFSATLDERVQNLANNIMNKEKCLFIDTIDKNEPEAHERIEQSLVISKSFADNIFATIDHLKSKLAENGSTTIGDYKAILFTPTVKFTKLISSILTKEFGDQSFPIYEFHGQVSQSRRTNLVKSFKSDSSGLLICTDVAARGMDFPNVKEVLQIGVPTELANYIHRIGRTARSGKDGKSIIFLCQNELPFIDQLKRIKNIDIINKFPYESNNETRDHLASCLQSEPLILENFSESIISLISYYRSCIKEYRFNEREILPEIARTYGLLLNESEEKLPVIRNVIDRLGLTRNPISKKMFHIIGRDQNEERFDRANIHRYEMRENRYHHSYSDMKNQYKKRFDSSRRHHTA